MSEFEQLKKDLVFSRQDRDSVISKQSVLNGRFLINGQETTNIALSFQGEIFETRKSKNSQSGTEDIIDVLAYTNHFNSIDEQYSLKDPETDPLQTRLGEILFILDKPEGENFSRYFAKDGKIVIITYGYKEQETSIVEYLIITDPIDFAELTAAEPGTQIF